MKRRDFYAVMVALGPLFALAESGSPTPMFWSGRSDLSADACLTSLDCRAVFPGDPILRGMMYSAIGWDLDAVPDSSRTVTVTARPGTLVNGVFTPDSGVPEVTLLAETTGRGEFDWGNTPDVGRRIYQFTHTVRKNGVLDEAGILCGYVDFRDCEIYESQYEVMRAVLAEFTHEIEVVQDGYNPWQPADVSTTRSGIFTDEALDQDEETLTTFTFNGVGVFRYEYKLDGGQLLPVVDGVEGEALATAGDWSAGRVEFADGGDHEISFVFTGAGDGSTAGLRNVQWTQAASFACASDAGTGIRFDLREGVRAPRYLSQVLPFAYSSTNWIGDVSGASAESVAKVTIVQLTGTDPDVRNWTEEVPNTFAELVKEPGEGVVKWKPRKGVWKATFDILNSEDSIRQEESVFDLRNSRSPGLALILSSLYTCR